MPYDFTTDPVFRALFNPQGYPVNAFGVPVTPDQPEYIAAYSRNGPSSWAPNPNYNPNYKGGGSPAPPPPHYQFNWDTIGQTIPRMIGDCRLPGRPIWARGVVNNGTDITTATATIALAFGMPIDPDRTFLLASIFIGGFIVWDGSTFTAPDGIDSTVASQMETAIANSVFYPGTQGQDPDPSIVADKGADVTNAFRGICYIVLPDWPLAAGMPTDISAGLRLPDSSYSAAAVEFAAGLS